MTMTDSMTEASQSETIHATSVAIGGHGVLILGPSGSGKSDLALRLIDRGAVLISDDYTIASSHNGRLILSAPRNIAGVMEIRHLGLVQTPHMSEVAARLVIKLDPSPMRMPETGSQFRLAGVDLPMVTLAGLEASAPIKAEWVLRRLVEGTTL